MKFMLLCGAFALLFSSTAFSQTSLPWSVIGSGGSIGQQGANRTLSATIGQVIIGIGVITDGSRISQGFWLPIDQAVSVDDDVSANGSGAVTNYPNPFTTSTTIRFEQPVEGPVTVQIFDLVGNLVRTLNAELSAAGAQEILFNGLTDSGAPLASGTYLYEVSMVSATGEHVRAIQRLSIVR